VAQGYPLKSFIFLHLTQGQISATARRLSGESETLVVGVYSVSSGLTSELVLGMP
jgi:hypothetical protein